MLDGILRLNYVRCLTPPWPEWRKPSNLTRQRTTNQQGSDALRGGKTFLLATLKLAALLFPINLFSPFETTYRNRNRQRSTRSTMSWILTRLEGRFSQSLRLPTPSAPQESEKALLIHVPESVFLEENMIVDSRRVSNREGLGWMERMERETQAQRNIIDQLREDSKMQRWSTKNLRTKYKVKKLP